MIEDLNYEEPHWRIIPLKTFFITIVSIIFILFVSTILICSTNKECNHKIPILNNLLTTNITNTYVITEINFIFGLHCVISIAIYYMTQSNRLHIITTLLVYISIVITLFVLPFTDWSNNYANLLIIGSIIFWMISVIITLNYHYRHIRGRKQWLLVWNITCCIVYILSSVVYIILRSFFSSELSGFLAVEISGSLSFFIFLLVCIVHVWELQLQIKI